MSSRCDSNKLSDFGFRSRSIVSRQYPERRCAYYIYVCVCMLCIHKGVNIYTKYFSFKNTVEAFVHLKFVSH